MARRRGLFRIAAVSAGALVMAAAVPLVAANAAPTRVEAESATLSQAAAASTHAGFSGAGYVDYTNAAGGFIQWSVDAASAGPATLAIRFANGTAASRPMDISVNGTVVASGVSFPGTGAWNAWQTRSVTATLDAGANTIRATGTGATGGPNVDFLEVDQATAPPPGGDLQAEDATISQGTVATNHTGFTGRGFVDYTNVAGSYVQWTVTAESAASVNFEIRYANGATANRPMTVEVNGAAVAANLAFGPTGSWDTWANAGFTANLNPGSNTVRATATGAAGGPNVDRLRVGSGGPPDPGGAPTAAELLAKVTTCNQISNGRYRTDQEASPTIQVCDKNGAVFWKADMDIDCDGQRTAQCNENTDCCFLPDTAFHQSDGRPLNAAALPYVVLPSPSGIWDYRSFQLGGATAVAIIYNNQVLYAPVGDTGPPQIIGEASYAAAASLGINPDPRNGGVDSGVTYIFFKGSRRVTPIENHNAATTLGEQLAREFINNN